MCGNLSYVPTDLTKFGISDAHKLTVWDLGFPSNLGCPNFGARPGLLHPTSEEVLAVWVLSFLMAICAAPSIFPVINNANDASLKAADQWQPFTQVRSRPFHCIARLNHLKSSQCHKRAPYAP